LTFISGHYLSITGISTLKKKRLTVAANYGIAFLIGCSSQFLIALDLLIFYADIADRLTQPKIGCCNQKLAAGAN